MKLIISVIAALFLQPLMSSEKNPTQLYDKIVKHYFDNTDFEALNIAIKNNPNNPRVWRQRAEYYKMLGERDKAIADINQALHLAPNDAELFFERGNIRHFNDNKRLADYKEAVRINPKFAFAWSAIGSLYSKQKRYTEALEAYALAIENAPSSNKASLFRSAVFHIYVALGERDKAIDTLQLAISEEPNAWMAGTLQNLLDDFIAKNNHPTLPEK